MSGRILEAVSVERSEILEEEITALHGSGNTLFLGHSNGHLIAYSLRPEKSCVKAELWAEASLRGGGAIRALESASALARLFVLSGGGFLLLRLQDLEEVPKGPRLRNVSAFALNEAPPPTQDDDPFAVELALAFTSGSVKVATLANDKLTFTAEISTTGGPLALAIDGRSLCWGTSSGYALHDLTEGRTHDLFPLEKGPPVIVKVDREEFLLSGMGGLGVFVAAGGVSRRAPLHWGVEGVVGAAVLKPYLLGLGEESVGVQSLLEESGLLQELHLPNPVALLNCEGQIYAASAHSLHNLRLVSWLSQIQTMLSEARVKEARELAQYALKAGSLPDSDLDIFSRIDAHGVFVALRDGDWPEVERLAESSQLDVREVASLFPDILPPTSSFSRQANPPLHALPDISALREVDEGELWACLLSLLRTARGKGWTESYRSELDSALLKVAGQCGELETALAEVGEVATTAATVEESREWLKGRGCFAALASLQAHAGDWSGALETWRALEEESLSDPAYKGFQELFPLLASCPTQLLLSTGRWLLQRSPSLALALFLHQRERRELLLGAVQLLEEAKRRGLLAQLLSSAPDLLEEEERESTRLCLLYADLIQHPEETTEGGSIWSESELRARLRRFLLQSERFDSEAVLRRLETGGSALSTEAAFLKGKLGDHLGALELLVSGDGDPRAAEEYVQVVCESLPQHERRPLHTALFRLLLSLRPGNDLPVANLRRLLSQSDVSLEPGEVVWSLPERWPLASILAFLRRSGEWKSAERRAASLSLALAQASERTRRRRLASLQGRGVALSETESCALCGEIFVDAAVVAYPRGGLVHSHCLRHGNLCPTTGFLYPSRPTNSPPSATH